MPGKIWTSEEDKIIVEMYEDTSTKLLSELLNRTENSIYNRANLLGLKKSEKYLKSEQSGRIIKFSDLGAKHRFKKGHQPKNKGLSISEFMSEDAIKRSAATRFKKGHIPANAKKEGDGAISIRKDKSGHKYKYIRISLGKWELLSRVVWAKHHGQIPLDHVIIFKDGDTLNCAIDNLECISKRENMKRNSYHRFGKEIASAIQLRGAVNRQINKHLKKLRDEK